MSRDPDERPFGWGLGECLWSPGRKPNGSRWGYWETMLQVCKGDVVFHLAGHAGDWAFVGFSTAAGESFTTDNNPDKRQGDYRVDLANFTPFEEVVLLAEVFEKKGQRLGEYLAKNKGQKGSVDYRLLFYVKQSNKLQCQNGGYLTMLDDELLNILFGVRVQNSTQGVTVVAPHSKAGAELKLAAVRIGQRDFSQNVRANFGGKCCFPGCEVADERFLVGAHIARWSDVEELRGKTDNGLCLCLFHDKAFEIGSFTLDKNLCVSLGEGDNQEWLAKLLSPATGNQIRTAAIPPSVEALGHHWARHNFDFS